MIGEVPREVHLALVKRMEELEEKVASQDETIRYLRMLPADTGREEFGDMAGHFRELVQKRAKQYQELMGSLRQALRAGLPNPKE